ncbi:hypothetical protein NDU88_003646 [Pleurodeles waltl]|uniref:Uncharacterized protein n=1 Tax=Pleurodeles waltl TaxID=8319 RepID=A0AAV7LJ64_PLEWA|nr:hypothetical protein NDU88_003646 [Pleurodeles waltl]
MGRAATPASYYSVTVPIAGLPQHFQGPRPRSGAVPLRRPTGRIFTSLDLGPHRHLRCGGETRPESPSVFGPSAPEPRPLAAQLEAAASAARPGPQPSHSRPGQVHTSVPSGVAAGARSRPVPAATNN